MSTEAEDLKHQALLGRLAQLDDTNRYAAYEQDPHFRRDPKTGRILHCSTFGKNTANVVTFSVEPVLNKMKTVLNDGIPVYDDIEHVSIHVPGMERMNTFFGYVTAFHKWAYPLDYKRWKENQQEALAGTSLAVIPGLSPSVIKELELAGIRTVEQLAQVQDSVVVRLPGSYSLRDKAREIIETKAKNEANSEANKKFDEQESKIAALQAQIEQLLKLQAPASESAAVDVDTEEAAEETQKPKKSYYKPKGQ